MRFGVAVPSYGANATGPAVAELVAAAEELGFDSVWFADHIAVPDYAAAANLSPPFLETLRSPGEGLHVVDAPAPVPVWVGGNGAPARRRAALLGDGWHPLWMPDDRYAAARKEILALRQSAGIGGEFTFSFSCGRTRILDSDPGDWPAPSPRAPEGSEFRYAPAAWTAPDNRPRMVGVPDQFVADVRLLEAAGVDHVMLRFGEAGTGQLELFAREIAPAFAP